MKKATAAFVLALLAAAPGALAQPARTDITYARDVGAATFNLDGRLNEPMWAQAERFTLRYNQNAGRPGSGQKVESGTLVTPTDPQNATIHVLRKGNQLWLGVNAPDKSIGGGRGLQAGNWLFDGFIFNIQRRAEPSPTDNNFFGGGSPEFIYGWWHPGDTTATGGQKVNIKPRAFGAFACDFNEDTDPCVIRRDTTKWNYRTTWTGITNSDTHGDDGGYVTEMMIDLGQMGYDFSKLGGDRAPFNFAIEDADYRWPINATTEFTSRVWFQNQWANNFEHGAGYIVGGPGVTTTSGAVPAVEPAFRIGGLNGTTPTLDGRLTENIWTRTAQALALKYKDPILANLPNGGYDFARYFRPGVQGGSPTATVVDPSTARVKMFYKGDVLYVGVDVDDQAISGGVPSDFADGVRLTFHSMEVDSATSTLKRVGFEFSVDSTGAIRYGGNALGLRATDPTSVRAGLFLKGTSTAANPSDVDTGYSLEIAIDLVKALKYAPGRGNGVIWPGITFFDADFLQDVSASTLTRTWWMREGTNGPGAWVYLDPALVTAGEGETEVPGVITLRGAYPNPTNGATTLRYELPRAGLVQVDVYDVLGRRVAALRPGVQGTGEQRLALPSEDLAAGVYVYRVQVSGTDGSEGVVSGRFIRSR